jgi:hypothetical protein
MAVATDFGRCCRTVLAVSIGQERKNPWLMALVHVAVAGLKHAACRNFTAFDLSCVVYAPLAILSVGSVSAVGCCVVFHNPGGSLIPVRTVLP